jgi:internalin A
MLLLGLQMHPHMLATVVFCLCSGDGIGTPEQELKAVGAHYTKDAHGAISHIDLALVGDDDVERINLSRLTGLKSVFVGGQMTTDRTLAHLQTIPQSLERIRISSAPISDDGLLKLLRTNQSLQSLDLSGSPVGDKAMAGIGDLKKLQHLSLNKTKVTNTGMKDLANVRSIATLHLANTAISDEGLKHLKGASKLYSLILDGTRVTDRGLTDINELKNLLVLGVNSTEVTDAGKAVTKMALPRVRFYEVKKLSR